MSLHLVVAPRARARAAGRCCRRRRSSRASPACPCAAARASPRGCARLSARQNTSSPASITVSPSGMIGWSPRKIATMRASTAGMCWRRSLSGWPTSGPPLEGAHRHQADPAVGEVEHLQRLRELDQLDDVVGERSARGRSRGRPRSRRRRAAPARSRGSRCARTRAMRVGMLNMRAAMLAGDEVGLVGLRDRDQHVGVLDAGLDQHRRMRARCRPRCADRAGPAASRSRCGLEVDDA